MADVDRIALLTAVLALVPTACSTGAGDGRVDGSISLPSCDINTDSYDMEVSFFAASYYKGTLTIRLQRTGRSQTLSDGIIIEVKDVEAETSRLGKPEKILIEPDLDSFLKNGPSQGVPETSPDSPVRATLYLNDTCSENLYGLSTASGTITFDSIYVPDKEKRITGSFDLRFIDPRFWKSPSNIGPYAELSGEFDFNYMRGSPAQTFP